MDGENQAPLCISTYATCIISAACVYNPTWNASTNTLKHDELIIENQTD